MGHFFVLTDWILWFPKLLKKKKMSHGRTFVPPSFQPSPRSTVMVSDVATVHYGGKELRILYQFPCCKFINFHCCIYFIKVQVTRRKHLPMGFHVLFSLFCLMLKTKQFEIKRKQFEVRQKDTLVKTFHCRGPHATVCGQIVKHGACTLG